MPLTRLDNLISSKTGKYLYVSPDDFNATDALDNRGNSPLRPFVSIQRAFLEVARFSYLPDVDNDRFDQFTIMLAPGNHYIDNRPGVPDVETIPVFQFNQATQEWEANTDVSFDLSDPDNILYKFNGREGGATIPRGTSLVGTDLRRTQVRPLYVPDPADKDIPRTALFNVTGGCYFWQFTILDGDLTSNSPLYFVGSPSGVGKVYTQPNDNTNLAIPEFSHHKITNFVFADKQDLGLLYRKIARAFSDYQAPIDDVYVEGSSAPVTQSWSSTTAYNVSDRVLYNGKAYVANQVSTNVEPDSDATKWSELVIRNREFDYRVQENRIVGPLSDAVRLDEVTITDSSPAGVVTVKVRTKINHGFFPGQYVAVANNGLNTTLNGVFKVSYINPSDPKEFEYRVPTTATGLGLVSGTTYTAASTPALDTNATVQAEIDSVESASPYVFNVSIRSVWGICGIWADGRKATGFKSMVIAQYTGVSLQKDDRAFIRYDEFSNTWNQAPLTDAFATTPYHIKGDAYWKDDWRNFHVRASDDSFIQNVSIFAVGFADHFLLESGGDMSITNSNSNFGNTSMHSKGFKGFAFNQDKGGYITDIIPPKTLSSLRSKKQQYYAIDAQLSRDVSNTTRLYLGSDETRDPEVRPAVSVDGFRIGAKRNEKIYVKLDTSGAKEAELDPSGFKRWTARLTTLNPAGLGVGDLNRDGTPNTAQDVLAYNLRQDAANLIDANKDFIQSEAFGYVLERFPELQNIPYVNPNITADTGRYRDASNLIRANRSEIIDYAYNQMFTTFQNDPAFIAGNNETKCRRDIGFIVDALADDLYDGGNAAIIEATRAYFDASGVPLSNGLVNEERFAVFAFNRARDWAKKAISNKLSNTTLLNVSSITSSGTTVTVNTNTPHGLSAGDKIYVGGTRETGYNGTQYVISAGLSSTSFRYTVATAPSASPATGSFYVSTVTIDAASETDPAGRYKDASNLVTANRQEIIDRAFLEIASEYNEALWGTDWIVPGDSVNQQVNRYWDAYRLIQKNRNIIVETAYATVVASPPSPAPSNLLEKCKRDIGFFVDAVSMDIASAGGNRYTRKFVQQYFTNNTTLLTNGLAGEVTQSITAFNKARDAIKSAITNTLASFAGVVTSSPAGGTWVDGTTGSKTVYTDLTITAGPSTYGGGGSAIPNNNSAACADVRSAVDTLSLIVSDTLTAVDLATLPPETTGTADNAGEAKCKRDIGYIVDSIAQDLFWGGNEFTIGAVKEYFDGNTPISNGLVGEVSQSVIAFNAARDQVKRAVTNQLYSKNLDLSFGPASYSAGGSDVTYGASGNGATCTDVQSTVDNLFSIITTVISAGNLTSLPPVDNGDWDCANVRNTLDTLTQIITTAIDDGNLNNLPEENPGLWSQISEASKCKRDIGYIVEAITSDLRLGGNENTINAAEAYYTAIPLVNDTTDGNADGYTLDYIENEKTETLTAWKYVRDLAISAMRNHNTYIPGVSTTSGSAIITVPSTVGLVVGMSVKSVTTIPTGTGTNASTNYNDALEEVVGGRVVPKSSNVTSTIPSNAYIKKIGDGTNGLASNQIELGVRGSKLDVGTTVNATATTTTTNIFVQLDEGTWSTSLEPSVDLDVIQDYNYSAAGDSSIGAPNGECVSVSNSIVSYFQIIDNIINNGVGVVPRVPSTLSTGSLAQRATLFSLTEFDNTGAPTTNPHNMETGTPVRLVPRAKDGANVDKRLVRLPRGFETNKVYYVIAPGRKTDPYDYSTTIGFNGANQQTLMLATSEENAAAGIYIYSSETDGIDPNVEIDVYQYVLDINYDLHRYQTSLASGSTTQLETDRPHIFDIPNSNVTPQKVFFRVGTDIPGSALPTLASSFGGTVVNGQVEYYARYVSSTRFTVHQTLSDAINNLNPVTFISGSTAEFYTFASKKRSPVKFAPEVLTSGAWYLSTLSAGNTIIPRLKLSDFVGRARTTDTYFTRIDDDRSKEDRVYRLRYVIPKNLKTVRDPLRGFVIKIRNDETRRLLPQKILLKPTSTGSNVARFVAPNTGERLGLTITELRNLNPDFQSTYDPSPQGNPKRVETNSKVAFTIQSARKKNISGTEFLELTVFDIGVDDDGYKGKIFTTVKISVPQGGDGRFVANIADLPSSNTTNIVTWSGNSSGSARVHGYFAFEGQYYMILKDLTGNSELKYDANTATTFTQGSVTATLLDNPNGGRSNIDNFLYVVEGANVYTMTPGDTLNDDNGVSYTIASVEDVPDIENTFYIFDINTIRRRIPDQQDGIYYLTCLRGNISPYPTGAGVGTNFRDFKFSQPVSKLYPEFYKNDPEWYKGIDVNSATLLDPPPTVSAADNYVHGLVTVNDSKRSVTKETILDFVQDSGTGNYTYSLLSPTQDNRIQAKPGSASAGSEGRRIPIAGDSPYPLEQKLYVELRRPSIARSGNHTFEYLGFGPGNYSTGFPIRQEVVLSDTQDFYAQAKREDAGIVFYTGLNSNGDLYIGNRKINAITGEETFLEKAEVVSTEDDAGDLGTLVTTFESPVTFLDIITVNGGDGDKESFFQSPVVINNTTEFGVVPNYASLTIRTGEGTNTGYDPRLEYNIFGNRTGDIQLHQNTIRTAVLDFNARGAQEYSIRTGISNVLPDLFNTYGADQDDQTNFGLTITKGTTILNKALKSGDIILKGSETLFSGSLGWIYANDYVSLTRDGATPQLIGIEGSAAGVIVRLNFGTGITNSALGITSGTQIRISGATGAALSRLNGVWSVFSSSTIPFNSTDNFVHISISTNLPLSGRPFGYAVDSTSQPTIVVGRSRTAFKEVGVIGAEAIRTETQTAGDYKLGINTIARAPHSAYSNAFVSDETTPRANLDVVGTAFISGKTVNAFSSEPTTTRTLTLRNNALLVGGDSALPDTLATFRVSTTNNGRVGINVDVASLDRTFVVDGNARITGDYEIGGNLSIGTSTAIRNLTLSGDLAVNGGDLTSTSTTFNLLNNSTSPTLSLNFAGNATSINIGHIATASQTVNLGTAVTASQTLNIGTSALQDHTLNIGNLAANDTVLNIHNASTDSTVTIGTVPLDAASRSIITIGGGTNPTASIFTVRNSQTLLQGNLQINGNTLDVNPTGRTFNLFPSSLDAINIGTTTSTINIAGTAGTTTINNALQVNSSITAESNITLNGGLANSAVNVERNILGQLRISTISRDASNIATIVTTAAHNFAAGDRVTVDCSNTSFNQTTPIAITIVNATTFRYANTGPAVTTTNATGSIVRYDSASAPIGLQHNSSTLANQNVDYYRVIENIAGNITITGLATSKLLVASHFFNNGDAVRFNDIGNLSGVNTTTTYFIINSDTSGFQLSSTPATTPTLVSIVYSGSSTTPGSANIRLEATRVDNAGGGEFVGLIGNISTVERTSNVARIVLSSPLPTGSLVTGGYIEVVDCNLTQFNTQPTLVTVVNSTTLEYTSIGANVAVSSVTAGRVLNAGLYLNNPTGIFANDFLRIGREVVQTTSAPSTVLPFVVPVRRQQEGTALINHGDNTVVRRLVRTVNATFVSANATATAGSISLAEFGGSIAANDYLRIDKNTPNEEWVRITNILATNAQRFLINDGNAANNVFEVVSTTGDTNIRGDVTIGTNASLATGTATGGGNLRVHNSIELFGNTSTAVPDKQYFVITNGTAPRFYVEAATGRTRIYEGGNFEIFSDSFFGAAGGTFDKNRNDVAADLRFQVDGTTGNTASAGTLRVVGNTTIGGTFTVRDGVTVGAVGTGAVRFSVDNNGDALVSRYLTVDGLASATPAAATQVFRVMNLGVNGAVANDFVIRQDRSIQAFGRQNFYNANGGRRTIWLSNTGASDATAPVLQVNTQYLVRPSSTLVLKLPTDAITGDVIRIVDIAGNLNFNIHLVIRAQGGVAIQGSVGGSRLGGLTAAYSAGGELVVNTPNAAFGLIFLGATDSDGNSPPAGDQGWYLMEV